MEIDEIHEVFRFHGFDPMKVKIYEPFLRRDLKAHEYRFDYPTETGVFDYHFLIDCEIDPALLDLMIRAFVVKGVRQLRDKIGKVNRVQAG